MHDGWSNRSSRASRSRIYSKALPFAWFRVQVHAVLAYTRLLPYHSYLVRYVCASRSIDTALVCAGGQGSIANCPLIDRARSRDRLIDAAATTAERASTLVSMTVMFYTRTRVHGRGSVNSILVAASMGVHATVVYTRAGATAQLNKM